MKSGQSKAEKIALFAALSVLAPIVGAEESGGVRSDSRTVAPMKTYEIRYSRNWLDGIGSGIGVQANPRDIVIVDDPVYPGRKVLRVSISKNENFLKIANGVPRAELLFPQPVRFAQGTDYLIQWSTYIPADFAFDSKQAVIITQIHQGKWIGGPTVALALLGTRYALSERGGQSSANVSAGKWLCCADKDRGRWVSWALRYVADENGRRATTQLWRDGRSVFATQGVPNAYPGVQDAYLKMGLYKSGWNSEPSDVDRIAMLFGPVSVSSK
jgi:hypothetical protein